MAEIIDFLRERFGRVDAQLDAINRTQREYGQRITLLEQQMAQFSANEQNHYANVMLRLDGLADRLERIERRLDLVEG